MSLWDRFVRWVLSHSWRSSATAPPDATLCWAHWAFGQYGRGQSPATFEPETDLAWYQDGLWHDHETNNLVCAPDLWQPIFQPKLVEVNLGK